MALDTYKTENKSKEELIKELKVLRAQMAVLEEAKEARKRAEEETKLLKTLILSISEASDLHSALGTAIRKVCEATGWILGQAWIPSKDEKHLICSHAWHTSVSGLEKFRKLSEGFKFPPGTGLPGRVWSSKRPSWSQDVRQDSNFPRAPVAQEVGLKAGFAVPIISREKVIAVIEFFMLETKEEDAQLVSLVSAVANQLGTLFDRKQTEEKLKDSESIYQSLVENLPQNVMRKDLNGRFTFVNKYFCKILGKTENEILGKTDFDFYPEELATKYTNDDKKVIETGKVFEYIEENEPRGGKRIFVKVIKSPIYNLHRDIIGVQIIFWDITESKLAFEEHKKIQERYSQIYNSSMDAIGYATIDGTLIDVNDSYLKLTGYLREEIIGKKKYQELTAPEYRDYEHQIKEKVLKTGKPAEYEKEYIRKDGTRISAFLTTFLVKDTNGKPVGFSAIIKDTTDRKLIENKLKVLNESLEKQIEERTKELKESEEKYKKLIETANDAIFVADTETGTIIDANKQAEKLLGLPKNKIIGMHQSELHPKEERERYKKLFSDHVKHSGGISEELYVCNKNGEKIPVEISASVIEIGGKKIIQGIFRDLSRWKQVEQTRSQLASIVESSNDAVFSWTLDGINTSWNPSAERIYGYKASEIKNKHVSILVPPELQQEVTKIFEQIKQGKRIVNYETVRLKKGGTRIDVSLTISPVVDNNGKITGLSTIARDITEHKKLLAALEKAKKEEEQRKELQTIEKLASSPQTDTVTKLYGFTSLSKSFPDVFKEMVTRYERLLDLAQEEIETNKDNNVSEELLFMGKQLGFLRAGPKDVLEIHSATIKRKNGNYFSPKTQTYTEIGRRTSLELMGYLAIYYRNFTMSTKKITVIDDQGEKITSK